MQLPKKIRVGNKWYSVEVVEAMVEKGYMGKVYYPEQKIRSSVGIEVCHL